MAIKKGDKVVARNKYDFHLMGDKVGTVIELKVISSDWTVYNVRYPNVRGIFEYHDKELKLWEKKKVTKKKENPIIVLHEDDTTKDVINVVNAGLHGTGLSFKVKKNTPGAKEVIVYELKGKK